MNISIKQMCSAYGVCVTANMQQTEFLCSPTGTNHWVGLTTSLQVRGKIRPGRFPTPVPTLWQYDHLWLFLGSKSNTAHSHLFNSKKQVYGNVLQSMAKRFKTLTMNYQVLSLSGLRPFVAWLSPSWVKSSKEKLFKRQTTDIKKGLNKTLNLYWREKNGWRGGRISVETWLWNQTSLARQRRRSCRIKPQYVIMPPEYHAKYAKAFLLFQYFAVITS